MVTGVSLRQLKWLTVLVPIAFLALVDAVRRALQPELMLSWVGEVLVGGVVLFGALLFSETIFGRIERMQARLALQNRELLALHEAGLDVAGELRLELVLQKVVDHATQLIGARYGALSVPVGHGLLAVVLEQGKPLRLPDLNRDPRAVGFPEYHPPMRSLLAVPMVSGGHKHANASCVQVRRAPS
jgi:GAF domain-containing protein